jgi:hypothetical protein
VRSSPAYAVSNLELPAVGAAQKAGGLLVMLATAFAAWTGFRAGVAVWIPGAVCLAGLVVVARFWGHWRDARCAPARQLEARPDGSIWLHQAGVGPVALAVGRGTRLLGPSVFLDLRVGGTERPGRVQCWITPFDVPEHVMRQWSVVLLCDGRLA